MITRTAAGAVSAFALVALLTGCGSATTTSATSSSTTVAPASTTAEAPSTTPGQTSPSETTPASPSTSPSTVPAPGGTVKPTDDKTPQTRKVTGTVREGVEAGCLVLVTTIGETLQPMGAELKPGDKVTVEGYDLEGVQTTCMQGRPFKVVKVEQG